MKVCKCWIVMIVRRIKGRGNCRRFLAGNICHVWSYISVNKSYALWSNGKDRYATVIAQQRWPAWASCAVTSMQLWLFFSKTVCDLPDQHVIWNIKWPDVPFGNVVIRLLTFSATLKAISCITVMQYLLIESQFCDSQGHRLQKADANMSRGEIFSLFLPLASLLYLPSLFATLSPPSAHTEKNLKGSFIGTKKPKTKRGMRYASPME